MSDAPDPPTFYDGEKPFSCQLPGCEMKFNQNGALKVHERVHTGEKPFPCILPGCEMKFAQSGALKAHERVHTGERPFACPQPGCDMRFAHRSALNTHVRLHTGERPYRCMFEGCSAAFAQSSALKTHERTHTGEKPYVCKIEGCGMKFAQNSALRAHERIHTGEKPYQCLHENCGQRFARNSHLLVHQRVHTGEKPYLCSSEGCGSRFAHTSSLRKHERSQHGIGVSPSGSPQREDRGAEDSSALDAGTRRSRPRPRLDPSSLDVIGLGLTMHSSMLPHGYTHYSHLQHMIPLPAGAHMFTNGSLAPMQPSHGHGHALGHLNMSHVHHLHGPEDTMDSRITEHLHVVDDHDGSVPDFHTLHDEDIDPHAHHQHQHHHHHHHHVHHHHLGDDHEGVVAHMNSIVDVSSVTEDILDSHVRILNYGEINHSE